MNNLESFPTQEDMQELWDEMETEARNPQEITRPEPLNSEKRIEPDWDALLEE